MYRYVYMYNQFWRQGSQVGLTANLHCKDTQGQESLIEKLGTYLYEIQPSTKNVFGSNPKPKSKTWQTSVEKRRKHNKIKDREEKDNTAVA